MDKYSGAKVEGTKENNKPKLFSKKSNGFLKRFLAVFAISATCITTANFSQAKQKMNGVDASLFHQNMLKMPLTLPVDRDAIQVAINKGFTNEQKQYIKEAIEELDIDLTGIKYEILLDETGPANKCINIKNVDYIVNDALAVTNYNFTNYDHHILYPISIELDTENIEKDRCLDFYNYEQAFKRIVKHEMLHTLGLVDIYDIFERDDTIMYGYMTKNIKLDLSKRDKEVLNTVYRLKSDKKTAEITAITSTPKQVVMLSTNCQNKMKEEDFCL